MEIEDKDYDFVINKLKEGCRLNQYFKGEKYCQIVDDEGVIGYTSFLNYAKLKDHPDVIERTLPKTLEYRKLRILVHRDFKDKDYDL